MAPVRGRADAQVTPDERRVPIAEILRPELECALSRRGAGLVFGRAHDRPVAPHTINKRAGRAWAAQDTRPISLHECRHTFASPMIAAGVNAKALQTFMGHAWITIALDRYGHLFPVPRASRRPFCAFMQRSLNAAPGKSRRSSLPREAALDGPELS